MRMVVVCGLLAVTNAIGCGDDDTGSCPPGFMSAGAACIRSDGGAECMDEEICDGFDNDCDGEFDEHVTRACGAAMGICTVGQEVCVDGEYGECTGIAPLDEDCLRDGDEDCDGTVDEGCGPCTEGSTRVCGNDVGACSFGTQLCRADGSWASECSGGTAPGVELCNGIDDDCDGTTDEGTGGAACGLETGACSAGMEFCVAGTLACEGGVGPADESCNDVDDDCDGSADEGVLTAFYPDVDGDGFGDSEATPMHACTSPVGFVNNAMDCDDGCDVCWTGASEMCDGEDNDCSGTADVDEFACEQSAPTDCPTTCDSVGTGTCSTACQLPTGTECAPPAESCDYADSDCDGVVDEGTLAFGAARSPSGTDVDDVRLLPTATGFALFMLDGGRTLVQRLDSDGAPQGAAETIDTSGTNAMDVAAISSDVFVVVRRESSSVYARRVTISGSSIDPNPGGRTLISSTANALVSVAVAASSSAIWIAFAETDGDLFLARSNQNLGALVEQEVISPSRIAIDVGGSNRQLELNESSGAFTIAWEDDDGRLRFGRLDDGFGLSVQDRGVLDSSGHDPLIADDGAGNRVVAFVSGGSLRTWYLDAGSWGLRGGRSAPPPFGLAIPYEVSTADVGTFQRVDAAHSGGRWLFASHSGSTVRLTEVDDSGSLLGSDTVTSSGLQALALASRSDARTALAVGRAAGTQSYLVGCP